jgi:DNA-binding NtrC family response regulator
LVIDDDPAIRRSLDYALSDNNLKVSLAGTAAEGLAAYQRDTPAAVVLDLFLPDRHGLEVLREIREKDSEAAVIVVTASDKLRDAVEAMKLGAIEYMVKPYDVEALRMLIHQAIRTRRERMELGAQRKTQIGRYSFEGMATANATMKSVVGLALKFAQNPTVTVLIEGETGVGKEFMARAIHNSSPRAGGAFVAISCAAIPEALLESELFGHEAGAFTDARNRKAGLFELAEDGTLFLDEVAEMSTGMQAKLLRAVETKTFRRVGGTEDLSVDTRIISATNMDLERAMRDKRMREDLYYRLKGGHIRIPPLRERPEDILPLAGSLLSGICRELARNPLSISEEAGKALLSYRWPGNVRELRNVLERAAILQEAGDVLEADRLPPEIRSPGSGAVAGGGAGSLEEMERDHILRAYEEHGRKITLVAKALGISRTTLYEKLKKYGIVADKK